MIERSPAGWEVALTGQLGTLGLDVHFSVSDGPTAIIGPNGAGKTTLLRAIAGAQGPFSGTIKLLGQMLMDGEQALSPEARKIGYVPQGYALFPHLTVFKNVAFACPKTPDNARAALERFDALALSDRYPNQLSGGEKQRVALARAIAAAPKGLLLDEPLAALDVKSRRAMRSFLAAYLNGEPRPALVVTHDVRDVVALGGEVLVLEAGKIIQRGTAKELAAAPGSEFVAEFFEVLR